MLDVWQTTLRVRAGSRADLCHDLRELPSRIHAELDPDRLGCRFAGDRAPQIAGMLIGLAGAVLAASCILTFVFLGEDTPAPFDPPRRLVVRGPYRLVRNPMYIGAALALAGAAIFYQSRPLAAYLVLFVLVSHVFVVEDRGTGFAAHVRKRLRRLHSERRPLVAAVLDGCR